MTRSIKPQRMNHINLVVDDFDASNAHLAQLFDAEFLMDIPNPESHACLVEIGRVIFELFVPRNWLLNARYGPHYVGIEYQADMDVVRAAIAERGIRIVRDIGAAVHTHPADTLGVAFEFWSGYFHDNDWAALDGRKMLSAEHWRDHRLGLTGLKCWTLAVHDLAAAQNFLESFLGARAIYEAPRPTIAARAVGMRVADDVVELLVPTGPGALQDHLHRYGEGIRSTVLAVQDISAAQRWFADRQVALEPGTAEGALAVPAAANLGVIFEFAE